MPQLRAQSITHHLALIKSKLKHLSVFEEQLNSQKILTDLRFGNSYQTTKMYFLITITITFQLTWSMNITDTG